MSQNQNAANKRIEARLITFLPIVVKAKTHLFKDNEIEVFQVINISKNGIALVVSASLPVGEEVSLYIKLPFHNSISIKTSAVVKRCDDYIDKTINGKPYICTFLLSFEKEDKEIVDKFIREVIKDGSGIVDRRNPNRIANGLILTNPEKFITYKLSQENPGIRLRQLRTSDLDQLENVEIEAWGSDMCASRAMLESRLNTFPEGMIGAWVGGKLMGYVCMLMIKKSVLNKDFTWMGITDGGYIRATHDSNGDCLYGVSLSVSPKAPRSIAPMLIKEGGKLTVRKHLKGIYFGCRIPNYHKHSKRLSPENYIKATTKTGRALDPELSLYRQVNCLPIKIIPNYFKDPYSLDYGVLVAWQNPFHEFQKGEYPFFLKKILVEFT